MVGLAQLAFGPPNSDEEAKGFLSYLASRIVPEMWSGLAGATHVGPSRSRTSERRMHRAGSPKGTRRYARRVVGTPGCIPRA